MNTWDLDDDFPTVLEAFTYHQITSQQPEMISPSSHLNQLSLKYLMLLKNKSIAGYNNIPSFSMRNCANIFVTFLLIVINLSIRTSNYSDNCGIWQKPTKFLRKEIITVLRITVQFLSYQTSQRSSRDVFMTQYFCKLTRF